MKGLRPARPERNSPGQGVFAAALGYGYPKNSAALKGQGNMAQSLSKIISTKNREPVLSKAVRGDLFAYMIGILNSLDCVTITINGVEDHVHALIIMSKTISVSKMMAEMKGGSSRWLNSRDATKKHFEWQAGYGAFSVSESNIPNVIEYIAVQEEHHKKMTFQEK